MKKKLRTNAYCIIIRRQDGRAVGIPIFVGDAVEIGQHQFQVVETQRKAKKA